MHQFRDQLVPYQGAFGCNPLRIARPAVELSEKAEPWPSTLFRFPLRSEIQARTGTISKQVGDFFVIASISELLQGDLSSTGVHR